MCDNASRSGNEPSHRDIEALFLRDVKAILRLRLISACYKNVHHCRGPFKHTHTKKEKPANNPARKVSHPRVYANPLYFRVA